MGRKKRVVKRRGRDAKEPEEEEETPREETAADMLSDEGIIPTYAQNARRQQINSRDILINEVTVLYHGKPLLENTTVRLNYGNRYGLLGKNGCGKSTFMRVLGARALPIPEWIDIFHLRYEIEASEQTALEAVMTVDSERLALETEADRLNDRLTSEDEDLSDEDQETVVDRLTQIYERLEDMDAATAEVRASKILHGLGFSPEMQAKQTKDFSGGWRMRISLARALFVSPELLLLDEPTNHLDMEAVVWLEDYLSNWDKILLIVSHSQDFLNNVCTHIIDFTQKRLEYYTGNYDTFVQTRAELQESQMKRYNYEQDQIKSMKNYIARFGHGSAKLAKQAQSKEKTLAKMERSGLTERVHMEKTWDFDFPDPGQLPPPILQCREMSFGYGDGPLLYRNLEYNVDLDSRIALVGPNGTGKSTFLKILNGDLIPNEGSIIPRSHLRMSMFTQHFVDIMDLEMTALDFMMQTFGDTGPEDSRKWLGRFGLGGDLQTQIMGNMSDGQKTRVALAKIAREAPHILLLDEPTNHLDMESIDSLARAIQRFQGGMLLVSHDMRLISQVAEEIWVCGNETLTRFNGDIADFKLILKEELKED
jgi:ATP-binding cassette subfamily F protein 2